MIQSRENKSQEDVRRRLPRAKRWMALARFPEHLCPLLILPGVVFWFFCIQLLGWTWAHAADQKPTATQSTDDKKEPAFEKLLRSHVDTLAVKIGERNLRKYKALCDAADYIETEFKSYGYQPRRQKYEVLGRDCFNIDVEIKGTKSPKEIVIIGGHYDSAAGTPGANDNGSGTAAMLVLAEHFRKHKPERTLRFVAWTNEEPPYFQHRGQMGSWVYAEKCRREDQGIVAVLSLETMGYYTDEAKSQKYPPPLNMLYPSTGNFVGFVANVPSNDLQRQVIKIFRKNAKIPSVGASLPDALPGVGWSDHWSFWQEGYVGLMVTDTAPFRYPHYHRATDTPDKINFPELTKAVDGLVFVVEELVKQPVKKEKKNKTKRKLKSQPTINNKFKSNPKPAPLQHR